MMRRTILFLSVVVLVLASCSGGAEEGKPSASRPSESTTPASSRTTPVPVPAGTIAAATEGAGIYVIGTDGAGRTVLTSTIDGRPDWSPDGTKITHDSERGPTWSDVWVMNADGSKKVLLTHGSRGGGDPAWSPDGARIAFGNALAGPAEPTHIYVMDADGKHVRQVTSGDNVDLLPTWTPDGAIVFLRVLDAETGFGEVFSVNPDGSGLVSLTSGWKVGGYALSPDGKRIAIQDGEGDRIVVLRTNGEGAPVTIVDAGSELSFGLEDSFLHLTWSPDGEALAMAGDTMRAYVWGTDYAPGLYIVNVDGSGLTAVPSAEDAMDPDWRPA